jgi:hypothetical protein
MHCGPSHRTVSLQLTTRKPSRRARRRGSPLNACLYVVSGPPTGTRLDEHFEREIENVYSGLRKSCDTFRPGGGILLLFLFRLNRCLTDSSLLTMLQLNLSTVVSIVSLFSLRTRISCISSFIIFLYKIWPDFQALSSGFSALVFSPTKVGSLCPHIHLTRIDS